MSNSASGGGSVRSPQRKDESISKSKDKDSPTKFSPLSLFMKKKAGNSTEEESDGQEFFDPSGTNEEGRMEEAEDSEELEDGRRRCPRKHGKRLGMEGPRMSLIGTPTKYAGTTSSESLDDEQPTSTARMQRDEEDSSDAINTSKKKRAKSRKEVTYVEEGKRKTQRVRERCTTLQEKCKELVLMGGTKVHFRAEYVGLGGRIYPYSFGEYFAFNSSKVSPQKSVPETLETIVSRAVAKGMKGRPRLSTDLDTSNSVLDLSQTPTTGRKSKTKRANACCICDQSGDVIVLRDHLGGETKEISTISLLCAHEDENGELCTRLVHADCLGFPGVTDADVNRMPDWYCKRHRPDGRMKKNALLADAISQPSKKPKTAKKDKSIFAKMKDNFKKPKEAATKKKKAARESSLDTSESEGTKPKGRKAKGKKN